MDVLQTLLLGLVAGAIATVLFTAVEYAEMAVTRRPTSLVPGKVFVAMTGGNPQTDTERARKWNLPTHLMHGTGLGLVFAALSLLDLSATLTTVLFYVVLLGGDWLLYSALGVTKPAEWSGADWAREVGLKAVFAFLLGIAFYTLIELF
ncbi:hypothetical protein E4P41_12030 [Geodermatophilus sp. DF01-2]|uniref:hypothetical protein n=1 Tax=Geodermatophilus sp. DF01-2 TaxID=2559610 RepID=UPI0010731686|nr:hypothetical protein [Geodermatophilus sp. DF01_2]TFV59293.1 hypothetical protein E4P41_12030 [Geodermatophilus sp. DF01_2]